jgi:hypothetical protein
MSLEKLYSGHNQAKDFLHLLGIMASCIDLIPNARLYETNSTSPVKFLETSFSKLDVNIPFTQHLKSIQFFYSLYCWCHYAQIQVMLFSDLELDMIFDCLLWNLVKLEDWDIFPDPELNVVCSDSLLTNRLGRLLRFWKPVSQKLDVNIPFTQHLKSHLSWWKNGANTLKGRHFQQTKTNITITRWFGTTLFVDVLYYCSVVGSDQHSLIPDLTQKMIHCQINSF